jgi:hypothetical protein
MKCTSVVLAAGLLTLAGMSSAAAQALIVEDPYAGPVYDAAPPPYYSAPIVVAPAPRVYAEPAPVYRTVVPVRPSTREVVVTEPNWAPVPDVVYSNW